MQGSVREIAVDVVTAGGDRLPVLVNSVRVSDEHGTPRGVRTTLLDATERKAYERELLAARDREREARAQSENIAHVLQQSLIAGTLPPDPRFTVETLYRPAGARLAVGGYWYDAFAVPGGRVGIVVGDVVGRGLSAATAMGQLRSAVRALAMTGAGPEAVALYLDAFVEQTEAARYATLALAEVDPDAGEVVFTAAGHPPPVVFAPGEPPKAFMGGRSTPLGVPVPRTQASFAVPPGGGFVLYTDGLVERRGEPIEAGIARLAAAVGVRPVPAELTDALLADDERADDVCVLVFTRTPR
jgi:serine phosphatase RsbU (regulator of sigma subunit)